MAFSANNQRRRDEQAARRAALSPAEQFKQKEELDRDALILAEAGRKATEDVSRVEIIDGMRTRIVGRRKVHSMTEDEARKRMPEIWNHPDLKTMTAEEHETLALELRQIALEYGIGGRCQ
jgi:hypothetical protein